MGQQQHAIKNSEKANELLHINTATAGSFKNAAPPPGGSAWPEQPAPAELP